MIRFPDNSVKVLVKGADSSMFSVLSKSNEIADGDAPSSSYIRQTTQRHLTEYSLEGLRTLVVAAKDLTGQELEEWQVRYEEASTSLSERAVKLRHTAAFIESNLNLLGATAIEDKLQDGVPETIEALRQAGIKVWVLTGDKQETAISIALSCRLLTQNMQQIIINGNSESECQNLLANAKSKYGVQSANGKVKKVMQTNNINKDHLESFDELKISGLSAIANAPMSLKSISPRGGSAAHNIPLALIIDGNSLVYILEKDLEQEVCISSLNCTCHQLSNDMLVGVSWQWFGLILVLHPNYLI